jgi:hypothetical protein
MGTNGNPEVLQLSQSAPVPEPMSLFLLGGCLVFVGRKLTARVARS